ncbi:hypothetical protein Syun_003242 [Stephania yunnanensis]|uniref:Uncharacterized protein n=1 Tax=Stephania yunnanensis TaxID=152371 RepID=A0AAP0Q0G0_9MAGN
MSAPVFVFPRRNRRRESLRGDGELGGEKSRTEECEGGRRDIAEDVAAAEEGRRQLSRPESGHECKGSGEVRGRGEARRRGGEPSAFGGGVARARGARSAHAVHHDRLGGGEGGGPVKEEEALSRPQLIWDRLWICEDGCGDWGF